MNNIGFDEQIKNLGRPQTLNFKEKNRQTYVNRSDYERRPSNDRYESEKKKNFVGKALGITGGVLTAATLVLGGICFKKGKKALEGKNASFKETLEEGWKELMNKRPKGGDGKPPKPSDGNRPTETPKPETPKTETTKTNKKPGEEAPKTETPKTETTKTNKKPGEEAPKAETPKTETTKIETPKANTEPVKKPFNRSDYPRSYTIQENGQTLTVKEEILTDFQNNEYLRKTISDSKNNILEETDYRSGSITEKRYKTIYKNGKEEKTIYFNDNKPSWELYPDGSKRCYFEDGSLGELIKPEAKVKMPKGFKVQEPYTIKENGQTLTVKEEILTDFQNNEYLRKTISDSKNNILEETDYKSGSITEKRYKTIYKNGKEEKTIYFNDNKPSWELYPDGSKKCYLDDGSLGELIKPDKPVTFD